jgi:hypothetical protein
MKRNLEIEAVLERSLRKQVSVRQLDESFDAAVWARIEAEESKAAAPRAVRPAAPSGAGRWLSIVNALGIVSVAVVLCVYGFQWLGGLRLEGSLPDFSPVISERNAVQWSTGIAGAALLFAFLYTPWGRRLRDEFL